ncbi:hypothetical protein MRB53_037924 [Persea americana]|nr:hypothetical protein MRB53_037924 [Persea americana]
MHNLLLLALLALGATAQTSTTDCTTQVNACRTAPEANQAYCSSQLCSCLAANNQTAGGPAYCQFSSTTTAVPTATPSAAPMVELCNTQANECRTAPNTNQASCSSNLCSCIAASQQLSAAPAYCGFNTTSTAISTSSTASSSSSAPSSSGSSAPSYTSCTATSYSCRSAPGANQAQCSSDYCACLRSASTDALAQGPAYCGGASTSSSTTVAPVLPSGTATTTASPVLFTGAAARAHLFVDGNVGAGAGIGAACVAAVAFLF